MRVMSYTVHVNPRPFFIESNLKQVALNDPGCVARAHPTAALSYCDPGLLNQRRLFSFCTHPMASSERDIIISYWTK